MEKISHLVNSAPGIPRRGVSAYPWWSKALRGVSRHGKGVRFNGTIRSATVFPPVIHTAASFDSQLWYRICQAIGREARAMYNAGQALGLTFWAWGRDQETPGKDPLILGEYAISYVTKQALADTYQPPFQSCVQQGQASGIMCAYNRFNGVPNCADYNLLTKTARGLWGFQGYIASDCDAVAIIHDVQGYAKLPKDAAADILKAGSVDSIPLHNI